jgi:hypothetical protein
LPWFATEEVQQMTIRRNPEPGRQAVLWLATAFVILIGAAACAFIIVVAVEHPSRHLMILGAIFGAVVVLLISMAVSGERRVGGGMLRLWFAARDRTKPGNVLRIGRKRRSERSDYGTNPPPTVESVREASDQNVSWVPHGPPPDRPRPG